jgi:hypothetical protein
VTELRLAKNISVGREIRKKVSFGCKREQPDPELADRAEAFCDRILP